MLRSTITKAAGSLFKAVGGSRQAAPATPRTATIQRTGPAPAPVGGGSDLLSRLAAAPPPPAAAAASAEEEHDEVEAEASKPAPKVTARAHVAPARAVDAPASLTPATVASPEPEASSSFRAAAAAAAQGALGHAVHADQSSTSLEAYRARAVANGRDPSELASEGWNHAQDGGRFWGPVDNESSRAFADGKVLTIDQWECITCGTCEENTAHVFHLPADEKARVLRQDGAMDLIQDAIDQCPVTCINWIDSAEVAEDQHSHGGWEPA